MGVTCLSIAPFTVILAHWFERKRGTANGLLGVGIGLGIFILVPLIQYLISSRGWQFAFFIFSLLISCHPSSSQCTLFKTSTSRNGPLSRRRFLSHLNERDHEKIQSNKAYSPPLFRRDQELKEIFKTAQFWYVICIPPSRLSVSISSSSIM